MTQTLPARETKTYRTQNLGNGLIVSIPAAAQLVPDDQFAHLRPGQSGEYPVVPFQFGGPIVDHAHRLAYGDTLTLPLDAQPAPAREPIPATYGTPAAACGCCGHERKRLGGRGRRRRAEEWRVSLWVALVIAVVGGAGVWAGITLAAGLVTR